VIVGVDEANAAEGRVAFTAPVARAVLGKRVGETATLRTARGEEELEVTAIAYEAA
jgi:transcription elongation factor GreB